MGGRYYVTAKGRDDLAHASVCECTIRIVGLLVECQTCGTVYGYTRESALASSPFQSKAD